MTNVAVLFARSDSIYKTLAGADVWDAERLPSVTKAEREHTPPALAEWLVEVARRCKLTK